MDVLSHIQKGKSAVLFTWKSWCLGRVSTAQGPSGSLCHHLPPPPPATTRCGWHIKRLSATPVLPPCPHVFLASLSLSPSVLLCLPPLPSWLCSCLSASTPSLPFLLPSLPYIRFVACCDFSGGHLGMGPPGVSPPPQSYISNITQNV